MERDQANGRISPSTSAETGGGASVATARSAANLLPNYCSRAVQQALEHLASVDLINLCNEAKVERCRATRDLRSCGRSVQYVLNSCGHASLCSECSQRCDLCPICRIPIPKNGNRFRLRLYYECIEAGLISKRCDERFQEKEDEDNQLNVDVQRLYSLFDVSLQNNLVSLICHYVSDVCMDEGAVSSDPVIAFLLDEVVVKDWCKRAFRNIIMELHGIYSCEAEDMKTKLNSLLKFSLHLGGISNVLEVLELSFNDSWSARLHDLQVLQESVSKTKQHLEIMTWCLRHQFLENVPSRYDSFTHWCSIVRERRSAAIKRSWPAAGNLSVESNIQEGSLFIEDALENLEVHQDVGEMGEDSELSSLQKDGDSFFRSKIEGLRGSYPFECLRVAVDILFLHGSSDMVVAKQAILLYYLFDRHWTMPDETWRDIVDDFAATFGITRHSLLESLTFYLLDDHTDEALQEACDLLPEISSPSTHPKIAQVLLERGIPETALMVLRWSGRDGSQMISLTEAVTAVRVRVQCGLLTEAFMHQRMLCSKVRERKMKGGPPLVVSGDLKGECVNWEDWVEALVSEVCYLCIRNNFVDKMIELPWNSDEEKFLHKCLLDCAIDDPSSTTGSLLVVFYLQHYRYAEAYQVDLKLQSLEQDFVSKNSISEEVLARVRSASHWRAELVAKSMELLPQVQQHQIKSGQYLPEVYNPSDEVKMPASSDVSMVQGPMSSSLLVPPPDSSLFPQNNHMTSFKPSVLETPMRVGGSAKNVNFELGKYGSPVVLHGRFFTGADKVLEPQVKHDSILTTMVHRASPISATPSKEFTRASSKLLPKSPLRHNLFDKVSPELEQNGFTKPSLTGSPLYSQRVTANPADLSGGNVVFSDDSDKVQWSNMSSKRVHSLGEDRFWNLTSEDPMDISGSGGEKGFPVGEKNNSDGPRWRSDEASDEEEGPNLEKVAGLASRTSASRGTRGSRRFVRR